MKADALTIDGQVAPGFNTVALAFHDAFEGRPEMGASLVIYRDGTPVISLHGGVADARSGAPWTAQTATPVFSCSKGMMSVLLAQLVQEGRLDYAAKVASLWPDYAAEGKGETSVAEAISHRAGLSAVRDWLTSPEQIADFDGMAARLAAQKPLWEPGTGHAYHALTHGWLTGEIARRASGQPPAEAFAARIAAPLGADVWFGLPEAEAPRVAHVRVHPALSEAWVEEAKKDSPEAPYWPYRSMTFGAALPADLVTEDGGWNDPMLQRAVIPGAGAIATADGLARIWSATVRPTGGTRLLTDETLALATQTQSEGPHVFEGPGPFAAWGMGVQLDSEARRYLGPTSFGHDGAGGQCAFADSEAGIGFAFVTNWMEGAGDDRATRIIEELRDAL
ncbi:serine hydrolase domain-containing protein [Pseudoroseicyclus tamaricis]|uniref:serine hydrolase domain-containing protein n=1 Tax=Pseudoroseicyclus tamaricis TaxID=2705421 RepID=UPI00193F350A|nr:serine hydrolase domain-containing protein [Pseudoroseicyclus tamaricis]